jgi:hypothetical protein
MTNLKQPEEAAGLKSWEDLHIFLPWNLYELAVARQPHIFLSLIYFAA